VIYKGYKWSYNLTSLVVNGKIPCKCIITVAMCGVDSIEIKIIQDLCYNQVHPSI
jgi:hypothetical protein